MTRIAPSVSCSLSIIAVMAMAGTASAQSAPPATSPPPPPLPALRLVDQRTIEAAGSRIISMSPDGRWLVAARPGVGYQRGQLCVVDIDTLADRSCADLSVLDAGLRIEDVTWSPDGSQLALAEIGFMTLTDGDLWLMDAATGALTNLDDDGFEGRILLTDDPPAGDPITVPVNPAFSPDGTTIAFSRSVIDGPAHRNTISTVPVAGGPVTDLLTVADDTIGVVYFGIAWAPDGSRLYYSYQSQHRDDPHNGVWVVNADGTDPRLLVGAYQDSYGPAVLDVSADGSTLLLQDPVAMGEYRNRLPVYATADTTTGVPVPVELQADHLLGAYIFWAGLSPDGASLLTVVRNTSPDGQVWLRPVGGTDEVALVPEGIDQVGPIDRGIPLTWSPNGTAFLTGAGRFETGTLLTIEGGTAP